MASTAARLLATAVLIAAPLLTLAPTATAATTGITLGRIWYDSPGADKGSNTSLNQEYVTVRNTTKKTVALKGWKINDRSGHSYTIPGGSLAPGKSARIHTGKGTNNGSHRYWGKTWYVWNNTGDTATLTSPTGKKADTCTWRNPSRSYTNC